MADCFLIRNFKLNFANCSSRCLFRWWFEEEICSTVVVLFSWFKIGGFCNAFTVDAMSIGGSTDFLMTLIAMFVILVVAFLSVMVVRASFNKSLPSANLAATSNNDCVSSN